MKLLGNDVDNGRVFEGEFTEIVSLSDKELAIMARTIMARSRIEAELSLAGHIGTANAVRNLPDSVRKKLEKELGY